MITTIQSLSLTYAWVLYDLQGWCVWPVPVCVCVCVYRSPTCAVLFAVSASFGNAGWRLGAKRGGRRETQSSPGVCAPAAGPAGSGLPRGGTSPTLSPLVAGGGALETWAGLPCYLRKMSSQPTLEAPWISLPGHLCSLSWNPGGWWLLRDLGFRSSREWGTGLL